MENQRRQSGKSREEKMSRLSRGGRCDAYFMKT
jgi:hypothetical protein